LEIEVSTDNTEIYAGGIAGFTDVIIFSNTEWIAPMEASSGAEGNITFDSVSGKIYAGGIVGRTYALYVSSWGTLVPADDNYIKNCFSTILIMSGSAAANLRIGGMVGAFYTNKTIEPTTQNSDIEAVLKSFFQGTNAFYAESNTSITGEVSGVFANGSFTTTAPFSVTAVVRFTTIEELKESGVYFKP
jgi:hypothetical protein